MDTGEIIAIALAGLGILFHALRFDVTHWLEMREARREKREAEKKAEAEQEKIREKQAGCRHLWEKFSPSDSAIYSAEFYGRQSTPSRYECHYCGASHGGVFKKVVKIGWIETIEPPVKGLG